MADIRPVSIDPEVLGWSLGAGESAVLSAARSLSATAILDDGEARKAARALGIRLTGTLGLVIAGARSGQVSSATHVIEAQPDRRRLPFHGHAPGRGVHRDDEFLVCLQLVLERRVGAQSPQKSARRVRHTKSRGASCQAATSRSAKRSRAPRHERSAGGEDSPGQCGRCSPPKGLRSGRVPAPTTDGMRRGRPSGRVERCRCGSMRCASRRHPQDRSGTIRPAQRRGR